ncbi:MAG: EEP domain-containing protein [Gammaproteobacteria bacterium]|nr:EEP domain-containing protein [Gammaproteobacteria bacterium]
MKRTDYQWLRLLSYNIQTGVDTRHFRQYLTQSWKHVLPHRERQLNLDRIAAIVKDYDIVGLQEVDSGSLRSGFLDQTEYLAHRGGFPFWHKQVNRKLGKLAQHSNGVLSHMKPSKISEHKLPGLPGRGVILCEFGGAGGVTVCILHLALGRRARLRQVSFVSELVSELPHVVIMGDLNCSCESREMQLLMSRVNLWEPGRKLRTFPSWRPMRKLDHILVSDSLIVENARVLDYPLSDHLPISIEVQLPKGLELAA